MKKKTEFNFNDTEKVHIIQLKKRKYWWLLLFLLLFLPLLLLIRFEKDLIFKTVNQTNMSILAGSNVKFIYTDQVFFDFSDTEFLKTDTLSFQDTTNNQGIVIFKNISYTLFSVLFHADDKAEVYATNNCFSADSLRPIFKDLKNNEETILKLKERTYNIDFQVVDKSDNQPLPEADIELTDQNGKIYKAKTNAHGEVVFENISYCSQIKVKGSKYGYSDDSLSNKVAIIVSDTEKRKLRLDPIKDIIKFIVKDLYTKELLPEVNAKLIIENTTINLTTNTNGVGKGVFENVHIIKKMHIETSKTFYYDTITPTYLVGKFVKLSEKDRTIYMRSQTQSIEFNNIDGASGTRLAGVNNKISINGKFVSNQISNSNGIFTVAKVFPNDKISIISSKNGFITNSTKVKNKTFSDLNTAQSRTVPLNKKPPPPPPPPADDDEFEGEEGDLRINLQWKTLDDLDLLVTDPCGQKIWALTLTQTCKGGVGTLDIDANTNRFSKSLWTRKPQENAFWENPTKGKYTVRVEHCIKQDFQRPDPVKFNVTIIHKGKRSDYKGQVTETKTVFVVNYVVQ